MVYAPQQCNLCPRLCSTNRRRVNGLCGAGSHMRIARAAPHMWEEPCLSGTCGSGAVFFAGCSLGCLFCQNHTISRGGAGQTTSPPQLANIFLRLQNSGVHNINLVTATHYRPWVQAALKQARAGGLVLPIVYNTGGYETLQSIKTLSPDVDIWLTDLKFYDASLSTQLANAPNYFAVAAAALQAMCSASGPPVFSGGGLLQKGVIVRLLVLPGHRQDAIHLLRWMAEHLPKDGFLLSLMSQYTPPNAAKLPSPLHRRVSSFEYNAVAEEAMRLGLTAGYMQQRSSAEASYTPPFDGTGLP